MLVKNVPILDGMSPYPAPLVAIEMDFPDQDSVDLGEEPSVMVNVDILLEMIRLGYLGIYLDEGEQMMGSYEADFFMLLKEQCRSKESAEILAEWLDGWAKDIRKIYGLTEGINHE